MTASRDNPGAEHRPAGERSRHAASEETLRLAERLDALLPQTQCTQCGFDGCRPYADAMARGEAGIDRCPPGGPDGVRALAQLLNVPEVPLDTSRGSYGPLEVAVIDEAHCIGCTLCIQACPVDAIVGANLRMHTVIEAECTGCKLCIAPCPVDCIEMRPVQPQTWWRPVDADLARGRFSRRRERLARLQEVAHRLRPGAEVVAPTAEPADALPASPEPVAADSADAKRAAIAAALAKARERRHAGR